LSRNEALTLNLWPETAHALGVGKNAIYQAARRGEIPTLRIGRRILVPRAALDRLLEEGWTDKSAVSVR
jgi:excisionase family DNA binding protein